MEASGWTRRTFERKYFNASKRYFTCDFGQRPRIGSRATMCKRNRKRACEMVPSMYIFLIFLAIATYKFKNKEFTCNTIIVYLFS